ncbi:hypothetical protein [Pseudonocardia humida]|uniref:Uncharacterized protein n=1 Tax=Pseudonocardia humida TaxID=2800819 RepID=A0ABT0ZT42_9PSEU|nr:hypothetical protein [Pseudonocardia humida]
MNGLRPRVEEITAELIDGMGPTAELIGECAYPLPITDRLPGMALDGAEPRWLAMPGVRRLGSLSVRLR